MRTDPTMSPSTSRPLERGVCEVPSASGRRPARSRNLLRRWRGSVAANLGFAAALAFFSGCAVGPNYEPPEMRTPDAWEQNVSKQFETTEPSLKTWWTVFNDPILDELVAKAGGGNLDLQIAAARIEEAGALRGVARSALFPQVDGVGSAQATRSSEETTPFIPPGMDRETPYYTLGGQMDWELDLWGRIRRQAQSATARLEASIEDYRDTLVILYAEVAATYVEVRTLQARIRYLSENAEAQRKTLELTGNLNSAGLVGDLDVSQATLNLKRTESAIPPLRAALVQAINRLGVLTGDFPGTLHELVREPKPIPVPPDVVTLGLPAELLRQRPDLRRAERILASETALIGAAQAQKYPAFFLPGTLTLDALEVGRMFSGGAASYSFGPTFRWTLFAGGRIRNRVRASEARTKAALLSYEQTLLLAVEEAENAMVAFAQERDRIALVTAARDAARKSVGLVMDQYRNGLAYFQNVLDMERSLAVEADNLAISRGTLAQNLVLIYRALGGGWDIDAVPPVETKGARNVATAE